MIHTLVQRFKRLDRDIDALSNVLIGLIALLAVRAALLVYQCQYEVLWSLLGPGTTLVAALLVARVASRLIANGNLIREDDRRQELARTTHHLLAIAQDLRNRVGFVQALFKDRSRPAFALVQIATTIERRYETLLEKDAYKFLPGKCIDIIIRMSGSIFGLGLLAEGVQRMTASSPMSSLSDVGMNDKKAPEERMDELITDLDALIDGLYEVRNSIDRKKSGL